MSVHPEDLIQQLAAVEIIAADILSDKQQVEYSNSIINRPLCILYIHLTDS